MARKMDGGNGEGNGEATEPTAPTPEQQFEAIVRQVGNKARDINKAVRDWRAGEDETEDLLLKIQLGQRSLSKSLRAMASAHNELLAAAAKAAKPAETAD